VAALQNPQIYPEKPAKIEWEGFTRGDFRRLKAGLRGVP
jgi:hypothetical protein